MPPPSLLRTCPRCGASDAVEIPRGETVAPEDVVVCKRCGGQLKVVIAWLGLEPYEPPWSELDEIDTEVGIKRPKELNELNDEEKKDE